MKKIIPFLILLLLCGCAGNTEEKKVEPAKNTYCGDENKDGACGLEEPADMSGYEDFDSKDSRFVKSEMKEALAMFKEGKSGILYFGYPKCPWCVEALPIMNEIAKEDNLNIHYIRTRDDDKKLLYTEQEKKEFIQYTEKYLEKDDEGNYQIYVPFVVVVKDGKAISGHIGTVDSHDAHERKMNEKEKKELKALYTKMFAEGKGK